MGKLRIIDNMKAFVVQNTNAMDRTLNRMAMDIDVRAKELVPIGPMKSQNKNSHSSGQLKSSIRHVRKGILNYIVYANMEYAAYQEFGMWPDKSHVIKHHTYPGRITHYLGTAGKELSKKAIDYFRQEANTIKV